MKMIIIIYVFVENIVVLTYISFAQLSRLLSRYCESVIKMYGDSFETPCVCLAHTCVVCKPINSRSK